MLLLKILSIFILILLIENENTLIADFHHLENLVHLNGN